jgi:hypothetical protein
MRLVKLVTPASTRVVRPQASSPSFEGALRQSSPKVARSACYPPCSSLLQHSSLRIRSKVISSPLFDEVNWELLSLLWSHTFNFDFAIWSFRNYIDPNTPSLDLPQYRTYIPASHREFKPTKNPQWLHH